MSINVLMMTPQNFSIPAGFNEVITFDVDPAITPTLQDTVIWWRVWEEEFGIPIAGSFPLIEKSSEAPSDITASDSPLSFMVQMFTADTINMLRNYYHEARILNALGQRIGGSYGIMTVTATMDRGDSP